MHSVFIPGIWEENDGKSADFRQQELVDHATRMDHKPLGAGPSSPDGCQGRLLCSSDVFKDHGG